jgi:hypothetical protein
MGYVEKEQIPGKKKQKARCGFTVGEHSAASDCAKLWPEPRHPGCRRKSKEAGSSSSKEKKAQRTRLYDHCPGKLTGLTYVVVRYLVVLSKTNINSNNTRSPSDEAQL